MVKPGGNSIREGGGVGLENQGTVLMLLPHHYDCPQQLVEPLKQFSSACKCGIIVRCAVWHHLLPQPDYRGLATSSSRDLTVARSQTRCISSCS